MIIYQREPVFTVGQAPFVAGAIHVRNQIRILKQREKAGKRNALVERIGLLRITLRRYASRRPNLGLRRTGVMGSPRRAHDRAVTATAKF
jgi:hypothetical protein